MITLANQAAIIGLAGRLPGAYHLEDLWEVLREGRCTISPAPKDRWMTERFLHPRASELGFSYTFAGGYLEKPFDFDPLAFGISPREATQIDPQQRLLLEVVWEALEDAGIPPSSLAGENIGVFVGASNVDYQSAASVDHSVIESHFVTGISLAIASNRISYAFDWKGPSMTIDTACSSSIVALAQAMEAIALGKIDTAIVAGVNMLLSPAPYIGFSRARMLSPTGLCRPFSEAADGYVRSEGAVALVLRRLETASNDRIRAVVVGAGVNSDGRTSGLSVPSVYGQTELIRSLYETLAVSPSDLAFVEAHGTGTPVGDPIEARAIGEALGQERSTPLPVGSVKSNIGHLESASGMAALAKIVFSFENNLYPRTIHLDSPSSAIPFTQYNIAPATTDITLNKDSRPVMAGLCNYGFGGTNAHAVLRSPSDSEAARVPTGDIVPANRLIVSAHSVEALKELCGHYADLITQPDADVDQIARAAAHQRDLLTHRAVFPIPNRDVAVSRLRRFEKGDSAAAIAGVQRAGSKVALVFSGNGCQWVGMGLAALERNSDFAREMRAIDAYFRPVAGWSLIEALGDPALAKRLPETSVAQPLIFAIQSALNEILRQHGLQPVCVLGHSVGEIAAAQASGALSRKDAVRLVFERSKHQEIARGRGGMIAAALSVDEAAALVEEVGSGLEIAAVNAPRSVTVSGPQDALAIFTLEARRRRIPTIRLDIEYPFHSALLDTEREALIADLADLPHTANDIPFISTVTGSQLDHDALDANYWWRNIRQPVQFREAIESAAALGATLFVEMSPKPILLNAISETCHETNHIASVLGTFGESERTEEDPVLSIVTRLVVAGAIPIDEGLFGSRPEAWQRLPHYPWQRQSCAPSRTGEALEAFGGLTGGRRHPLAGTRLMQGSPEWRLLIDAHTLPFLADHKVGEEVVVPGAALIEMVLAVGRDILGDGPIGVEDLDVVRALILPSDAMREVSIRYEASLSRIEIWSRPRFAEDWSLHAFGRVKLLEAALDAQQVAPLGGPEAWSTIENTEDEVYEASMNAGLNYGHCFRRVTGIQRDESAVIADLRESLIEGGALPNDFVLDPSSLDAAFHGLFIAWPQTEGQKKAHLPVRIHSLRVHRPNTPIVRTHVRLIREGERSKIVDGRLFDAAGDLVADFEGVYLRATLLSRMLPDERILQTPLKLLRHHEEAELSALQAATEELAPLPKPWLLLRAGLIAAAHDALSRIAGGNTIVLDDAIASGALSESSRRLAGDCLTLLASADLATVTDDRWTILQECPFPPLARLVATFAERFPGAQVEMLLATNVSLTLHERLVSGKGEVSKEVLTLFDTQATLFDGVRAGIMRVLAELGEALAFRQPRVLLLEPVAAGLGELLTQAAAHGEIELVVIDTDNTAAPSFKEGSIGISRIRLTDLEKLAGSMGIRVADCLIASPEALFETTRSERARALSGILSPRAFAAILQPPDDPALDILSGLQRAGATGAPDLDYSSAARSSTETMKALSTLGFQHVGEHRKDTAAPCILTAIRRVASPATVVSDVMLPAFAFTRDGDAVDGLLASALRERAGTGPIVALDLPPSPSNDDEDRHEEALKEIEERALALTQWLEKHGSGEHVGRLIIVTRGAHAESMSANPAAAAMWSFGRVIMNEYPGLDTRLIDLTPTLDAHAASEKLLDLLKHMGADAELILSETGIHTPQVTRGAYASAKAPDTLRRVLAADIGVSFEQFEWRWMPRRAPGEQEIEVAVEAVGQNFRDVLVALGVLDEDLLGGGLTKAAMGFELAGRVVRCGPDVDDLKPGDLVMGFARDAFASHVSGPRWQFTKIPRTLSAEEAATIPVAFTTAWIALEEIARLQEGETVLIHGAVGGVGMAAMQIAKSRGARILATAGSPERRELARMLGADAAYDSRSLAFADDIRAEHGGVDVVVNSLAGEAMRASLRLLRPFGRFVELGKRDYLDNSAISLRPFVRNLSYFGLDLDEMLAHDRSRIERALQRLSALFEDGTFTPLPYRCFVGENVSTAFRLMQRSGHIGKIIVTPAKKALPAKAEPRFIPAPGVHIVIGGTSGFGLESALWLARQGAERVVIASRRGQLAEVDRERVAAFGARIVTMPLDVTDRTAVDAAIARIRSEHGPIVGVIHTAMVLEDSLLGGLTRDQLSAVLRPKVLGIAALDEATRDDELQYFVAYSSATTLIGNPGQGAYILANAFLEGFMRKRLAAGKPGLAVAWGAIADAGVIARDQSLGERLARTTGVTGIPAKEALAHLGQLLAQEPREPVAIYSAIGRSAVADQLSILKTPSFRALANHDDGVGEEGVGDFALLIADKSDAQAMEMLLDVTRGELGRILRLDPASIDTSSPLSDIGMDSLMALELRLSVEKRLGVELPLLSLADKTIVDVSAKVLTGLRAKQLGQESASPDADETALLNVATEMVTAHGSSAELGAELATMIVEGRGKTAGE